MISTQFSLSKRTIGYILKQEEVEIYLLGRLMIEGAIEITQV